MVPALATRKAEIEATTAARPPFRPSPVAATPVVHDTLRLTAKQARGVATIVAFLDAYNGGQADAALALLDEQVVFSDCDYRAGSVVAGRGKAAAAAWPHAPERHRSPVRALSAPG